MSELRVALFTGNYNHMRDGVSQTLNRWVSYLQEQSIPVMVFGPTSENPEIDEVGAFYPVPSIAIPGRPEYRVSVNLPAQRKRELKSFAPNLVHIATPDILGYKALRYAQRNNITVVSSYHTHFTSYLKYYNLNFLEPLSWKYLCWFYKQCRHIYVPTKSMKQTLREKGISGDLRIWARGVNTNLFNPNKKNYEWRQSFGLNDEDFVVTFVSRLVWEKNLKTYVAAVELLKKKYPDIQGLVVGDGPAKEEMKKMMPNGVFTGFLRGEDLAKAYASSDVFMFPSDTETFGNVTLEAMSSGVPAVVANATGSRSLINPGINGFLAEADAPDEFAEQVSRIYNNRKLHKQMSIKAREKALNYSWSNVNSQLLENYHSAVRTPKSQLIA